jgi:hypothetical protein
MQRGGRSCTLDCLHAKSTVLLELCVESTNNAIHQLLRSIDFLSIPTDLVDCDVIRMSNIFYIVTKIFHGLSFLHFQ